MYQRLGCLRQRYQTPRTQRPPEVDHQTSSGQLPATVPPQQALVGCTQRTSNSHHNQILAIRRMGAYPWEHHQQPPRPTIWIEWRQDPPCEEAPVGVKVWAGYAYLERGVQQLTWSTATLRAAPAADSRLQLETISAQISVMSGAQELATWVGFGLNQMAPQQLHRGCPQEPVPLQVFRLNTMVSNLPGER